jgi:hypothetical protein
MRTEMFPNPLFSLYEREHFNDLKSNGIDRDSSTYAISIDIVDVSLCLPLQNRSRVALRNKKGAAKIAKSYLRGEGSISQWLLEAQMEKPRSQGGLRLMEVQSNASHGNRE